MGFALEVEMIRTARALDLVTTPYVFDVPSAQAMTEAGADVVVAHLGTTISGMIGASSALTLDDAVVFVQEIREAATAINPDVYVLCHGGPIAEPEDAAYVLQRTTGVAGFFGASSMERLPAERAITEQTRKFKSLTTR